MNNYFYNTWDKKATWIKNKSLLDIALGHLLPVTLLEQGAGPDDFQKSLPTSAILWFCV